MQKKIELLAPGGDLDSIKAAILGGADAVYCGLERFNARSRAVNISFTDFESVIRLAHSYHCRIFLTVNILIVERELPALIGLLNKLVNTAVDGIIIQDLGLFYLINNYFNSLKIHASTQLTTHNGGQIEFLYRLSAVRVNLCRELNLEEIRVLSDVAHKMEIETEVFVHGSYCICFSGLCYLSSVLSGKSGNRGRCSQPCRDRYQITPAGKNYPLNLKDNSAFADLKELAAAGADALKIEGRIKKSDYVFTVVNCWRRQIDSFYDHNRLLTDNSALYKVFNRDFSNSFLKGRPGEDAFIDNPRDNSLKSLDQEGQLSLYADKAEIQATVAEQISRLTLAKTALSICVEGQPGQPLRVKVSMPHRSFLLESAGCLTESSTESLDREMILKRFKPLNNAEYSLIDLDLSALQSGLFIPFQELTGLRKAIQSNLNGQRKEISLPNIPPLEHCSLTAGLPELAVLISSVDDLDLCAEISAKIYFQLPDGFRDKSGEYTALFQNNRKIIPWFPSILIGEDFDAAVKFLADVKPELIVTNNSGIAFAACQHGIHWLAGPCFNLVNSYSLICLKEKFNCSGAFISNEISQNQLKDINRPKDFQLCYSIYHPILLMTSRVCLFQQVTGCSKNRFDEKCLQECVRSALITNLHNQDFYMEKIPGNYHCLYNSRNYLNTAIITDLPDRFSTFMVDMRQIKTGTESIPDKKSFIRLFADLLKGDPLAPAIIREIVPSTTCEQYLRENIY